MEKQRRQPEWRKDHSMTGSETECLSRGLIKAGAPERRETERAIGS